MSIKGKILEVIWMNILKWFLIILLIGVVTYLIIPKYEVVNGKVFNKVTGRFTD